MKELTHISLFAGIGGIDLAAEWAGFRTVLFVENDKYCQKILNKHWPDVPIIGDIHDVRGKEYTAGLITGGFPCQPVSVAGKRRGKEDDRWLWPEMLRVIKEVRPIWVVAENVAGLIRMGIDDCISDLENIGYTTEPYLIPACAVNAPHRRGRIFIVAHDQSRRFGQKFNKFADKLLFEDKASQEFESSSRIVAESGSKGFENIQRSSHDTLLAGWATACDRSWWDTEPDVGRVAHGIPSRVDRLRTLGNAVVPQQIYPILKAIADIERETDSRC